MCLFTTDHAPTRILAFHGNNGDYYSRVVTPIGPVLTSATAVKNFDRPKSGLDSVDCTDFTALTSGNE